MDNTFEESAPFVNRLDSILSFMQAIKSVANRMIGFFNLTKEEESQAGIDLSGEGRGEPSISNFLLHASCKFQ